MSSMFDMARTKNALAPKFRVVKEDHVQRDGLAQVKCYRFQIFSKTHDNADWQLEYTKIYPVNYENLDYKINAIVSIIKENFYNFRNGVFTDVVMFSRDNIMFKDPELQYETKTLKGALMRSFLKDHLPLQDVMEYDIIDNKGGLKFFRTGDVVVVGKYVYYNAEIIAELHPLELDAVSTGSAQGYICLRDIVAEHTKVSLDEASIGSIYFNGSKIQ